MQITSSLRRHALIGLFTALLVPMVACGAGMQQGIDTGDSPGSPDSSANTPTDHLPPPSACVSEAPAPRALRRLTQRELSNSIADIFADPAGAPKPTALFNGDPPIYGFHNNYNALVIQAVDATTLMNFAEACGSYAASHVATLMPTCNQPTDPCRSQFLSTYGQKFFRQPMSPQLLAAYLPIMQAMPDFASGVNAAVSAMVQSPYFIYRSELGTASGSTYTLTPFEVASELSYTFAATTPDAPLLQAAAQNQLTTPAQLKAQAARLLLTPHGHQAAQEFFMEWLQLADLANLTRMEGTETLDKATSALMLQEGQQTVDDVMYAKNGTYQSLLTVPYSFVNAPLATYYGKAGAAPGAAFVAVPASALGRDPGVLGLGGVLAAAAQSTYASPTIRGRTLRMRLLCDSLGSPPPGVPQVNTATPDETLRQLFTAHVTAPSCASCHTLMDPLGFTMGNYDTMGRRRAGDMEMGHPVDTSGSITDAATNQSTPVAGLSELNTMLATSPQAAACLSRHWSMYALGSVSWAQDSCTFNAAAAGAAPSNYNLQQTLIALTQVPSFTQRAADR